MLRSVHVAERHLHHLPQDLDRIFGSRVGTKPDQSVHALCVTVAANVMTVGALCLARLPLMAKGAFHRFVFFRIDKRRFADQTFFAHGKPPLE